MKKKIALTCCALLYLLLITNAAFANGTVYGVNPGGGSWITETSHEHDCDAPLNGASLHDEHGPDDCGNTNTTVNHFPGARENCRDENRSQAGVLIDAQYLVCGDVTGPGGGAGCSYQWITKCGGRTVSVELVMPVNSSGGFPACWHSTVPGTPVWHSITCEQVKPGFVWGAPNAQYTQQSCTCTGVGSGGTFSCSGL